MAVATAALATLNVFLLIWALWILINIRDDQMTIRTAIAHQVRERRALMGAPVEDDAFFRWLAEHPDRPHKDDPPTTGSRQ